MSTTTSEPIMVFDPELDLQLVHEHPKNPRRSAVASDELVESVRSQGLVQALVVAPHPDLAGYYVLIAGHRRLDALLRAGYVTAKAEIRHDLTTEAQQIEAMLVENSARQDLTAIEEAEGYEQLQLFNLKPADIAKRVGRSQALVKSRLKLLKLSETGRERVHDGQVTIDDALHLVDLPAASRKRLEDRLGTPHFRYELEVERGRLHRTSLYEQDVLAATEAGVLAYSDEPADTWALHRAGEVERVYAERYSDGVAHLQRLHPECLRWANHPDHAGVPVLVYVCVDPTSHVPGADDSGPTDTRPTAVDDPFTARQLEEMERRRAENAARQEAMRAAAAVRTETLIGLPLPQLLRAALPLFVWVVDDYLATDDFEDHLGIERTGPARYDSTAPAWRAIANALDDCNDEQVLAAFAVLVAEQVNSTAFDTEENPLLARVFDLLLKVGHPFSDIDLEQHARALGNPIPDDEDGDDQ